MSDFQQCNCKSGEWQGQLCDICNGTGNAAIASMQGEYEPVGNYLVERLKSSNTCYNWINRQNQEAAAEIARLQKLSVTNILLEISPGFDGMGDEIYAKSVEDVYKAMAKLETKIDDQRGEIAKLQKELEEARKDAERYNWLCDTCVDFEEVSEGDSFAVKSLHFEYSPKMFLHEAIDQAMLATTRRRHSPD